MADRASDADGAHFQTFPVAGEPAEADIGTQGAVRSKGYVTVSSRTKAGFGGMMTVSAVLLAIQFITGIQAFPL